MKKILVLGGTGFVGRHVCEKLTQRGWRATVPTRRAANARCLQTLPLVDLALADVHDEQSLMRLATGHDAVVNLVAILHGNQQRFERVHVELAGKLARAGKAAGVPRIVHVSALGAAPDAPSMYQRSKAAGEAELAKAGLPVTVLRPSVVFGAEDRFLNLFARLQAFLPLMPLAGASTRFQPVWVEDLAEAIVRCLEAPGRNAALYECCGPETFTLRQLVELAGRESGHPRPVLELPFSLGRLQALMMELAPGEPLMSRDNLDSLRVDNLASGTVAGLDALGIAPAALSALAPGYLGKRDPLGAWRAAAGR